MSFNACICNGCKYLDICVIMSNSEYLLMVLNMFVKSLCCLAIVWNVCLPSVQCLVTE